MGLLTAGTGTASDSFTGFWDLTTYIGSNTSETGHILLILMGYLPFPEQRGKGVGVEGRNGRRLGKEDEGEAAAAM